MFKDICILLFGKRLNMAVSESLQLDIKELEKGEDINIYEKIIRQISSGKIKSPHISRDEAKQMIYLIDHLYKGVLNDNINSSEKEFGEDL